MTRLTLDDYQTNPLKAHQQYIKGMPVRHLKTVTRRNSNSITDMTNKIKRLTNQFVAFNYRKFCHHNHLNKHDDNNKKLYILKEQHMYQKLEKAYQQRLVLEFWYQEDIDAVQTK